MLDNNVFNNKKQSEIGYNTDTNFLLSIIVIFPINLRIGTVVFINRI